MKNSTSLRREHDFQGSGGSENTTFLLFFRVWFADGFGNGFFMIFRRIWDPFWFPKSIKTSSISGEPTSKNRKREPGEPKRHKKLRHFENWKSCSRLHESTITSIEIKNFVLSPTRKHDLPNQVQHAPGLSQNWKSCSRLHESTIVQSTIVQFQPTRIPVQHATVFPKVPVACS